jgi:aspartate-semialdehyde dehydrogenase
MKIAVVGATGVVGRTFIKVLGERAISAEYFLFASKNSAGKKMEICGRSETVLELNRENIEKVGADFALFSAGGDVAAQFAPIFANAGTIVIDNSSAFRRVDSVPLVVPECNPEDALKTSGKIIANPNCSTIGAVVALKPLDDLWKIKRVVYTTFQAVSGAGAAGIEDYTAGKDGAEPKKFPHKIFNNLIPQIDVFMENGNTKEEEKMIFETRKILHRPGLAVSATCVRVPIENAHSISVNVEFEKTPSVADARAALGKAPGIILADDPAHLVYPMPILANGRDEVFAGRIRIDDSRANTLNLFLCSDNIRKGAATNAVQILELLLKKAAK